MPVNRPTRLVPAAVLVAAAGLASGGPPANTRPPVELAPTDPRGGSWGWDVAVDGDVAVASGIFTSLPELYSGGVSVFRRNADGWTEEATFAADGLREFAFFGESCDVSGDTLVVGAPLDYSTHPVRDGQGYVFRHVGGRWVEEARLVASDASEADYFSGKVAIDGDTIVANSRHADSDLGDGVGAVYVFERTGTTWAETARFSPDDLLENTHFGESIAVDGVTVVAGAPGGVAEDGARTGAVYVFERGESGWAQTAKLSLRGGVAGDDLGFSVAVSGDTILAGAWGTDTDGDTDRGAVHAWVRKGRTWRYQQRLDPPAEIPVNLPDTTPLRFGLELDLRGDIALVSTNGRDLPGTEDAGSAYLFVRENGRWTCREELLRSAPGVRDYLGHGVGLSDDTAVVGAPVEIGPGYAVLFDEVPLRTSRVNVRALALALKYAEGAADRMTLSAQVPAVGVPESLDGRTATVAIGPLARSVTLDAKGRGSSGDAVVSVKRGRPGKPATVTLAVKGDFSAALASLGMDGTADAKKLRIPLDGSIDLGAGPVRIEGALVFTGAAGKAGRATWTRK